MPVSPTLEPLVTTPWVQAVIVLTAYVVTLSLSGAVVRFFVLPPGTPPLTAPPDGPRFNVSTVIGKCENVVTVTFVLLGQETGLALIFTAKSLVRSEEIKQNPGFFLGGTLVNLVWALAVAMVARVAVFGLP